MRRRTGSSSRSALLQRKAGLQRKVGTVHSSGIEANHNVHLTRLGDLLHWLIIKPQHGRRDGKLDGLRRPRFQKDLVEAL